MDKYHRQVAVVGAVAVALIIVAFVASRLIEAKLTQGQPLILKPGERADVDGTGFAFVDDRV